MEVCARRMWFPVMWYAGWCWAISTLVHTLLSPWRKKEKEHDRRSLGTERQRRFRGRRREDALITSYYVVSFNPTEPLT